MGQPEWGKVLIVQTSFLGDTVLTLPLIAEIKRRFPAAKVTLLSTPLGKELLDGSTALDEIIVDDKRHADKGWWGLWRKARALKAGGFTLALCPHKSFRSALLLFLARIPHRVGFRQSKGWFLFHSLANRNEQRHDVERNLSILEVFGIKAEDCRRTVEFPVHGDSMTVVSRLLKEQGISPRKSIVGIIPGSVWPTKRWAAESFAVLIQRLKRELDCEVSLIGGPEDVDVAGQIETRIPGVAVNLAGKTSLRELPAVLAHCRLLITNDSGPMHIAVAIGVPVVAIFCATTPSLGFYPYTSRAVVVEKNLSCRPCSSHGGRRCPLGTEDCIRLIEPDQVFQAAKCLLQDLAAMPTGDFAGYQPRFVCL
jgi:lipopolysaccharide heptosyltransferase II